MLDEELVQRFIVDAGHHYVADPPTYLECPICHNVLQDAVVCESGAHTFCEKCLKDWMAGSARPLCPIDREALKSGPDRPRRAPRALSEVIDALEVVCALGCGWKGGRACWPDHLRRDCPEVEGDDNEERQKRAGSVPLALRGIEDDVRPNESNDSQALPLSDGEERMSERSEPDTDEETGVICDVCQCDIRKVAYMCIDCPDYDICSECWMTGARTSHDRTHGFVKLRSRADFYPGEEISRLP